MDISSTDRKLSLNFRFLHGYCGAISLTDLSEFRHSTDVRVVVVLVLVT
jgi:hypothetical protein